MRILILGFGRMGISHSLQLVGNLLTRDVHAIVYISDPSFFARLLAKSFFKNVKFIKRENLQYFSDNFFDYAVDSSPPFNRVKNVEVFEKIAKKYLIEKPVKSQLGTKGMTGYVLQHNPLINDLTRILKSYDIASIEMEVRSNLLFDSGSGWRKGQNGGIINEFLGHLLSVVFASIKDSIILNQTSFEVDHSSLNLHFNAQPCQMNVKLVYGDESVRKTTYVWRFFSKSGEAIEFDLYSITLLSENGSRSWDIASNGFATEFYLRGFDFAQQCCAFLEGTGDVMSKTQIDCIDKTISKTIAAKL